MRRITVVALATACAAALACGSSKSSAPSGGAGGAGGAPPAAPGKAPMHRFTLTIPGEPSVTVELAVPAGWAPDTSGPEPAWKLDGVPMLMLAAISPTGDDDATRVRKAIRMQYGDDAGRVDLSGGRVWMQVQEGDNLHARIFVPYPGGVVMGVAMIGAGGTGKLAEIRTAFETLTVVGS